MRALVGLWAVNAMSLYRGLNEKPDMTSTTLAAGSLGDVAQAYRTYLRFNTSPINGSVVLGGGLALWNDFAWGVARRRTCWCSG